mmetsp:Transcript_4256/g.12272  ORF Transcript_4256/g.12272 Transcript_4256/m.12272 type:complete len:386 (+) Transcript_4256:195-1352(+)
MPELPEVEAARLLVQEWCIGQTVKSATIADDDKVIEGIGPKELEQALVGRKIQESCRKGKQMWIQFDQGPSLMLHLGMTGHVAVEGKESLKYMLAKAVDPSEWPPKYVKVQLNLSEGARMAFCDSRRFAKVKFLDDAAREAALPGGWDALNDSPTLEQLMARVGRKRVAIKSVLLDQAIYAGIGNWCADDILFEARIHPEEQACNLSSEQLEALRVSAQSVMRTAVDCGAESDKYPSDWLFHSRWAPKKAPPRISFLTIGGRTTALDAAVQKLNAPSDSEPPSPPKQKTKRAKEVKPAADSGDGTPEAVPPSKAVRSPAAKPKAAKSQAAKADTPHKAASRSAVGRAAPAAKPATKAQAAAQVGRPMGVLQLRHVRSAARILRWL